MYSITVMCTDCSIGFAKCPTGRRGESCIPKSFFCDEEADCELFNGTAFDEVNCSKHSDYCASSLVMLFHHCVL